MKEPRTILVPFFLLVLVAGLTAGFIQEITFHENVLGDGNHVTFRSNIPDTTAIAQLGPFGKICYRGVWRIYAEKNYMNTTYWRGSASTTGNLTCYNGPLDFQSARHYVASESEEAALSLYRDIAFSGPEILVTANELSGIEIPVQSYTVSAAARWTLFEGQYFNGKSICPPVVSPSNFVNGYDIKTLNLTKVGSVVKTCDPAQIRLTIQKYNKAA